MINDLLTHYKINLLKKEKNENNKFLKLLDKIGNYFQNFYKSFINYSTKDKALVIRDLIIIFLLISLFKIPFLVLENIIFSFFNNILSLKIVNLLNNVVEFLYISFAIITFIKLFKRRFKKELKID